MSQTTTSAQPNLSLLESLANHFPHEIDKLGDLISNDFVLHYVNSRLPELDGDYKGRDGLKGFFQKLGAMTKGTYRALDKQLVHVGDELIVTSAKSTMTINGNSFQTDALFIWRVVENQFVEAWDIPAVNTIRQLG